MLVIRREFARLVIISVLATACGRIGFDTVGGDGPDTAPSEGLLVWFRMEDDPTDGVFDSSGNGFTGTCTPARCPVVVAGKIGRAFRFDGTDDVVTIPFAPLLNTTSGYTVACWFRLDATLASTVFVAKQLGTDYGQSWILYLDTSDSPIFYSGVPGNEHFVSDFTRIALDRWTPAAITWDGTEKRLYIDGELRGQGTFSAGFDSHDILLGAMQASAPGYGNLLIGSLDEVRIYDRALSDIEIATLAQ